MANIYQEMEVKFPVVFVVFCFVLCGTTCKSLFLLSRAVCVCVCVCVNVKRAIFWISSLKQGQKSGGHANVRLVSHEPIKILVRSKISSTPSLRTRRLV
jgi:hypothetical protein